MENTVEIRYENVLEQVRQMPAEQLAKLLAEVRRIMAKKRPQKNEKQRKNERYLAELDESIAQLERGEGIRMTLDEVRQMLLN